MKHLLRLTALIGGLSLAGTAFAAWEHRYKKVDDYGHHIYLEQHEFPFLSSGPVDPAPSPDGRSLAFAAQGWLWLLDLDTGVATQLTDGSALDSRPRWSAEGKQLAFVRDDGRDTRLVLRDISSGRETIINTDAIELDPELSADGRYLYYSSAQSGVLSLWRRELATGADEELTQLPRTERSPRRLGRSGRIMYMHQAYPHRDLRLYDPASGEDQVIRSNMLAEIMGFDVHPGGQSVVFNFPTRDDYHLMVFDIDKPDTPRQLTFGTDYALMPAFSADGSTVFYVTPDTRQQFQLMQVPTAGGKAAPVAITRWDYLHAPARVAINTTNAGGEPAPARLALRRSDGHPIASTQGPTYFDSQNGLHYFYTHGELEIPVPAGRYEVTAARGLMGLPASVTVEVKAGRASRATLPVDTVWDAKAAGYVSADQHVHLNADGAFRVTLEDALPLLAGEDLDQLITMSWNKYNRYLDLDILGQQARNARGQLVFQSQEVRSGFHGHVGLIGNRDAFYPWFFGPRTPRYGRVDRSNGEVLDFAARSNVLATYVHPISGAQDPFDDFDANPIPLELVSDGVLSEEMGLELVCAWTTPLANAAVWYRLLNIGKPVYATSGTDAFVDFQRTPAMGTARLYTPDPSGNNRLQDVLQNTREGRSFLTTGPALLFSIGDGIEPGGVIAPGEQPWAVTLAAAEPVEAVEIVVNGTVVQRLEGIAAGATRRYRGSVFLPAGGWVAARAHGGVAGWPGMSADQFAHSSPIWIEARGSVHPPAAKAAAADLLRAIDHAEQQARKGYGDTPIPMMLGRFDAAREALRRWRDTPYAD
ncbi:MAG: CehA/McbA family metallohydrolase [Halieaceae bacterium]|jgi:TolB protein|nr:CehA/McbA family metallohydrolase [Halieaceae bacterium]